jgi:hypothetical protein
MIGLRRGNYLAAIISLLVVASAALYGIGHTFAINDDRLGHYYVMYRNSYDSALEAKYEKLNKDTRRILEQIGHDDVAFYRFGLRQTYDRNYLLASAIYYQTRRLIFPSAPTAADQFPRFLANAMLACFAASIVVAAIILAYLLLFHVGERMAWSIAVALAAMFVLKLLPTGGFTQSAALFSDSSLSLPFKIAVLLLKPDVQMDFSGYMQKSQFLLLIPAVFALRWSSGPGAGYISLFVAGLFHQAMSWLLFGPLLALDLVLRPRRLTDRSAILGLGLIVARALIGSRIATVVWQYESPATVLALAAGAVVVAVPVLVWWFRSGLAMRIRSRLLARGDILPDMLGLGIIWIIVLTVSVIVTAASERPDWLFWGVVAGRMLAIFRFAFFLGLAYAVVTCWLRLRHLKRALSAAAGLVVLSIALAIQLYRAPGVSAARDRGLRQVTMLEQQLHHRAPGPFKLADEDILLYAMVKSIETERDIVASTFR